MYYEQGTLYYVLEITEIYHSKSYLIIFVSQGYFSYTSYTDYVISKSCVKSTTKIY